MATYRDFSPRVSLLVVSVNFPTDLYGIIYPCIVLRLQLDRLATSMCFGLLAINLPPRPSSARAAAQPYTLCGSSASHARAIAHSDGVVRGESARFLFG